MRGLRKYLTPFAPDQSGAVGVLFELGGIIVIVDAGGCTGNVCGFDEPRWHTQRSAVFSAGLRDMDAILGRDDALVDKLAEAAHTIDARFAAIVGTPVPSVIGTDYHALRRMAEHKVDLPILTVDTTGMALYDVGAAKAYEELFARFAVQEQPVCESRIGVLGVSPLDLGITSNDALVEALPGAVCYGLGAGLDEVEAASSAERNVVVAPSGLRTAKLLQERFGTPYEVYDPLARAWARKLDAADIADAHVLVVHQQVSANTLREELLARGAASVRCATWFGRAAELTQPSDVHLREEDDLSELVASGNFDVIIADEVVRPLLGNSSTTFIDLPQFAISGRLVD